MSDVDTSFVGSVPHVYDSHMVPLVFEYYAADIASRISDLRPDALLELAAGSGVVTRAVAPVLDKNARYVVTDLNAAMLEQAKSRQSGDASIEWLPADALDLPFEDDTFDAVVCQIGVMFYPDRVLGHREARRVLKTGGHYVFNVWDCIEQNELANAVNDAAGQVFTDNPPQFMARTPHGYFDLEKLKFDLQAAGFTGMSVATLETQSRAPSARHAALAFCHGTPLRHEIEKRDSSRLGEVLSAAEELIRQRFGTGSVSGKMRAHVITVQK